MIYTKDAIYPYPVYRNNANDYVSDNFALDLELNENSDEYIFTIKYELESQFLAAMINQKRAELIFIIQAKDNKYFEIEENGCELRIPKNRLSLDKRTSTQLLLRANEEITFMDNDELNEYYNTIKAEIIVDAHAILALSNVVIYDGSTNKPFELFEKRLRKDLSSGISIELGEETIIINYKNENLQFASFAKSNELNYPYVYMGLQKALYKMIVELSEDSESLDIDTIEIPTNGLQLKLYNLLKSKKIEELNINNIDEVIDKVSDRILTKFYNTVKEMSVNGS